MRLLNSFSLKDIFLILLALVFSLYSYNKFETLISIATLYFAYKILWIKSDINVVFWGVLFQWLSINIKVFYANFVAIPFESNELHFYNDGILNVLYLSNIGIIIYSIGIRIGIGNRQEIDKNHDVISNIDLKKVFIVYYVFLVITGFFLGIKYLIPGIFQFLSAIEQVKWGILLFLTFLCFYQKKGYLLLFLTIVIQIIASLFSYFSTFKEVIIFFVLGLLFAQTKRIKFSQLILLILFSPFFLYLLLTWQAVKGEYRKFLSGGEAAQVVKVSREDALTNYFERAQNLSSEDYNNAILSSIDRISYIDYFSATYSYVPKYHPHENGKIWSDAITHIFKPRLFFPNKGVLDDSEHLNKYSGLSVSGEDRGTSISLGYMGDSYIDFGEKGMFVPIFLLALITGLIYRFILTKSSNLIWSVIILSPMYYHIAINGISAVKVSGRLTVYFLTSIILIKLIKQRIWPFIYNKQIEN